MLRTLTFAAATAAALTSLSPTPGSAMEQELNMLTGAIFMALQTRGLPTDAVQDLSLSEIATIKRILGSDESEGQKTQRVRAILERG